MIRIALFRKRNQPHHPLCRTLSLLVQCAIKYEPAPRADKRRVFPDAEASRAVARLRRTAIKARQSIPAIEPIRLIRIGKPCRMVITHAQYHHIERIIDLAHRLFQEILSIRACLRIPKGLSIFQRSFNGSISRHPFLRDATPGKRHRHSIFAILQRIQGILTNLACQGADPVPLESRHPSIRDSSRLSTVILREIPTPSCFSCHKRTSFS